MLCYIMLSYIILYYIILYYIILYYIQSKHNLYIIKISYIFRLIYGHFQANYKTKRNVHGSIHLLLLAW